MPAGSHDFEMEQGATFNRSILVKDGDGNPVDLSGASCRMQVRPFIESDTVIIELTTSNGRITIDGPLGQITLLVSAASTSSISQSGVYDLEVVYPDSSVDRLLKGSLVLSPEVTR